jgi:hypothetical protein
MVKDEVLPSPLPKRLYLRIPKKKKLVIPLPPLKKEKAWLELELELQAAYHRSVTVQAALLSRFVNTAPPAGDRQQQCYRPRRGVYGAGAGTNDTA